ncbi:MAG: hypothetical protein M3P93_01255 [Actinomycetota bacterium]|nr:hypothetical protein [Actinomycetota bacterium]
MAERRFALATSERGSRVDPDLPLARAAFAEAGLDVDVVRWDDPDADWAGYDLVVVRSCWDYAWRLEEFLAWADAVPRLRNPPEVLRWNVDKRYLRDVEAAGCPVVPTVWDPASAGELPDAEEWVVKPSVSAGSRDAARWTDPDDVLAHVAALVGAGRTAMVQPYVAAVDSAGETALLHVGGAFSHAVRKGPLLQRGEGVRQDRDSRGDLRPVTARPDQLEVARAALAAVRDRLGAEDLLYARVDVVDGPDGTPLLLELELTEPSLFLPQGDGAAARLATAVDAAARGR